MKTETRTVAAEFEVRTEGDTATISGYAAKYGTRSHDLGGWVEVVAAGAFDESIERNHDVRALFNHNPSIILGRTTSGTLKLSSDDTGLYYEVDANLRNTDVANVVTYIERGDVTQASFGFITPPGGVRWGLTADEYPQRTVERAHLKDISPATYPAYEDTEAAVRSLAELAGAPYEEFRDAVDAGRLRELLTTKDDPLADEEPKPEELETKPSGLTVMRRDWLGRRYRTD